jgi:ElaB/YqjD/DUF883 family membrane-anchored ribosome-binding protein
MARKNGSTADDIAAIEREIGKLIRDLENRIGRLNTLTRQGASHAATEATDYVTETVSETLERLRGSAEEATDRVRNGAHAVTDEASRVGGEAIRRIEEEIEQRPLMTLAIAAGIGFLAGMAGRRH